MTAYSALAAAAEVPLNTEEFQMSKMCRTTNGNWGLGLSGGVLRSRLTLDEFAEMFKSGSIQKMTCSGEEEDDNGLPDDFDANFSVPPGSMFG
jgi:hypothetical protein